MSDDRIFKQEDRRTATVDQRFVRFGSDIDTLRDRIDRLTATQREHNDALDALSDQVAELFDITHTNTNRIERLHDNPRPKNTDDEDPVTEVQNIDAAREAYLNADQRAAELRESAFHARRTAERAREHYLRLKDASFSPDTYVPRTHTSPEPINPPWDSGIRCGAKK